MLKPKEPAGAIRGLLGGEREEEKSNLARGGGEEGSGDALRHFPCLSCRRKRWMLRDELEQK